MNNNKNIKNIADKCQIFTPENYVKELLDSVGFSFSVSNSKTDGWIFVLIAHSKAPFIVGVAARYD